MVSLRRKKLRRAETSGDAIFLAAEKGLVLLCFFLILLFLEFGFVFVFALFFVSHKSLLSQVKCAELRILKLYTTLHQSVRSTLTGFKLRLRLSPSIGAGESGAGRGVVLVVYSTMIFRVVATTISRRQ